MHGGGMMGRFLGCAALIWSTTLSCVHDDTITEYENIDEEVNHSLSLPRELVSSIDLVSAKHHTDQATMNEWGARLSNNPTIIYLNHNGATVSPGMNDARSNQSSIVANVSSIPAWDVSEENWSTVLNCVQDLFAPFDVKIVDTDPGNTPHFESVIGGHSSDLGFPGGIAGLSPFTSRCDVIPNSMIYTFAEALPHGDPQLVCEITAQEIAHSFGLDHEFLCSDPMSYLWCEQPKKFRDEAAPCGEFDARSCKVDRLYDCGRSTQNSYQELAKHIGFAGGARLPVLKVNSPKDNEAVLPGDNFAVIASDDGAIEWVDFSIDGEAIDVDSEAPYEFTIPNDLLPGRYNLKFTTEDNAGLVSDLQLGVVILDPSDPDRFKDDGGDTTPVSPIQPANTDGGGCQSSGSNQHLFATLLMMMSFIFVRRRDSTRETTRS